MTQLSFATLDHQNKKKRTKREIFRLRPVCTALRDVAFPVMMSV
jgi:hypothetical protein